MRELREEAGRDPLQDRYSAGYLACIYDILNVDIEEVAINVD